MRRFLPSLALASLIGALAPSPALAVSGAQQSVVREQIGKWRLIDDTAQQCRLRTTQGNNNHLDIVMSTGGDLGVTVISRGWYMGRGFDLPPIDLLVDQQRFTPVDQQSVPPYGTFVAFGTEATPELISALSNGSLLEVRIDAARWIKFRLERMQPALYALYRCVAIKRAPKQDAALITGDVPA